MAFSIQVHMRLKLICFCLGVISSVWLAVLPSLLTSIFLLIQPVAIIFLYKIINKLTPENLHTLANIIRRSIITCSCFCAGLGYGCLLGNQHALESMPDNWPGKTIHITGRVTGLVQKNNNLWQFSMVDVESGDQQLKGGLRLSWYGFKTVCPGDYWQLSVRVKPIHGVVGPGAFNVESWLRREHIAGTGYVVNTKFNRCLSRNPWTISSLRYRLIKHIKKVLPDQKTGLAQALLLGNKKAISPDDWRLFNKTGTTHLLVISGLHIGLIFMLGHHFIKGIRFSSLLPLKHIALPRLAVLFGIFLSIFYALLAGFSVPVQRSLIMLVCGCAGKLLDFSPKASTIWLVALTGVLLFEPMVVTSSGFWYSFIAVGSLLLVFSNRNGTVVWWKRWLLPQWCVFVALLPLLLFYAQPSSWWSPVVNLVSIPLVGLIVVPLLMSGLLLTLVSDHFSWLLLAGVKLLNGWRDVLDKIASGIGVPDGITIPDIIVLIVCMCGVVCLLLPKELKWRWLGLPCLLTLWFPNNKTPPSGTVEIVLLDNNKTHIAIAQTKNHTMVFHMGDLSQNERFNSTDNTLLPYLKQRQINTINTLILPRHSSNTLSGKRLLQAKKVTSVYAVNPNKGENSCYQFKQWSWDGVEFTLLPGKTTCTLHLKAGKHCALFTGYASPFRMIQDAEKQSHWKNNHLWVTPFITKDPRIIQIISPKYIALSRHKLHIADKNISVFNKLNDHKFSGQTLNITAYTGTQHYLLGASKITVRTHRQNGKKWWYPHNKYKYNSFKVKKDL